MNALPTDNLSGTLPSSRFQCAWEALQEVLTVEHAMEGGVAVVEPLMEEEVEEEEEENQRRGSSLIGGLALRWAPVPEEAMPTGPGF